MNELGDFLAGAVAPLAFFWLILGYRQQGNELRLQREELKLQRGETKRIADSAQEQTKALGATQVAALTKQTEVMQYQADAYKAFADAQSAEADRERERQHLKDQLRLVLVRSSKTADKRTFYLQNSGARGTEVEVLIDDGQLVVTRPMLLTDEELQFQMSFYQEESQNSRARPVAVKYIDINSAPQVQHYPVQN